MHEPDGVPRALARWRQLGLALTIDDFGTGHASPSQLKNLHPERLKIECNLVRGLPDAADNDTPSEAMLPMADALHIQAVAEGVKTEAPRQGLLTHACARLQGHLKGPKLPAALQLA